MQLKWTDRFTWCRVPIRSDNTPEKSHKTIIQAIRIIWIKEVSGV